MENTQSNTNLVKKRIKWVDELKGAILVLICLGHLSGMVSSPPSLKYATEILSTVRVPTFFFLSGLLYSVKDSNYKAYLLRKTNSLLIPYLLLSLLFTMFDPYIYNPQYLIDYLHYPRFACLDWLGLESRCQTSLEFFVGDICCTAIGISSRATLPLWFVFVLYFVTIAYHWFFVRTKSQMAITIIAVMCFGLSFLLCFWRIGNYMKVGPSLMAFFFYWFGTIFVHWLRRMKEIPLLFHIGLSIFLFCVFYYLAPNIVKNVSFVNGVFPIKTPLTFLVCSFSGILCFVLLFMRFSQLNLWGVNFLKGLLRNIARNSLIILAMHYWALVFFHLFLSFYIPIAYQMIAAIVFVVLVCMASIALFRTRLYMFIGGERAKQSLRVCFSIS